MIEWRQEGWRQSTQLIVSAAQTKIYLAAAAAAVASVAAGAGCGCGAAVASAAAINVIKQDKYEESE